MWNDLILAHEGPFDTRDTKIAALRLKFITFKSLEGEKVNGTITRLKCLLNDLENNSVSIPQAKVNATFVNILPRKRLSMNQTQRAINSIKNDCLATLYGKYNYEECLIDHIFESETQRFNIQASSSKSLISSNHIQDSDSDVEEDQRTINEFVADLNAEYHKRALLKNQKRFYKRSRRVRIDDLTKENSKKGKNKKGKSDKGLIAESFDCGEESISLEDERTTKIRAFMAIDEDESSVGKADARSRGRGKKDKISSKEVIFSKADESSSMPFPDITSDSEFEGETQKLLPPLPKLIGVAPAAKKTPMIPKPFKECKYRGFNDHHSDNYEYYPGCELCGSIIHKPADCPMKHPNSKNQGLLTSDPLNPLKSRYLKDSGPKVVFRDDSSGDTEGYGSVNYNGITFTRVAYMNGLKHNLISISQLRDVNFKVLFTKT
uniref:Retrovirus-related Pol polyprotein from transposon TNT 1-94 n=1 Tax=Tanacetum cinerariifolium TaxID=118510 RepID=A0A6L2MPP0_TANCI|nr:retrovirus-related Pol polyprotein from transposon TNT 1-94 [Tanacetum cinerariifolium]